MSKRTPTFTEPPTPFPEGSEVLAGDPGYRITREGQVWGCKTPWPNKFYGEWRQRKLSQTAYGYLHIILRLNGRNKMGLVHRLVLETFAGPCPPGMQCRHRDGNRQNNRLENLSWGTAAENAADRAAHGTKVMGSQVGNSILNESQVAEIILLRGCPEFSIEEVGMRFGVSKDTVRAIQRGSSWKHVWSSLANIPRANRMVARGERAGGAKLNRHQVAEIIAMLAANRQTYKEIAAQYGVTRKNITAIATRRIWLHVRAELEAEDA